MDISKYIAGYRESYDNALAELAALTDRLEELDVERDGVITRIAEVREGVAALAPLVKGNPAETHPELFPDQSEAGADLGLTDAVRRVLANSNPKRLTPVGVRTGLAAIGFQTKSKNILPSIHTVLKRLEKNDEIISKTEEDGRTWYGWNGPIRTVATPMLPPPRRYNVEPRLPTPADLERQVTGERRRSQVAAERRRAEARAAKSAEIQRAENVIKAITEAGNPKKD